MNTEYLADFLAIVQYKTYAEAAAARYVSSASLSKHILSLESDLGYALFNRTTRTVQLTEYGKALLPFATQMVSLDQESRQCLLAVHENMNQNLRILSMPITEPTHIGQLLADFSAAFPGIVLQTTEVEAKNIYDQFSTGKFDFAFVGNPPPNINFLEFCQSPVIVVVPSSHRLANRPVVEIKDLRWENYILYEESTGIMRRLNKLFSAADVTPNIVYRGQNPMNLLKMVQKGFGISFMAENIFQYYQSDGLVAIPVENAPVLKVRLIWNRMVEKKACASKFIQYVRTWLEQDSLSGVNVYVR